MCRGRQKRTLCWITFRFLFIGGRATYDRNFKARQEHTCDKSLLFVFKWESYSSQKYKARQGNGFRWESYSSQKYKAMQGKARQGKAWQGKGRPGKSAPVIIAAHLERRGRSPRRMFSRTVSAMSSALCPVAILSACFTMTEKLYTVPGTKACTRHIT